jgi:hypothetical protein
VPDQPLGTDGRAAADEQLRAEPEEAAATVDEAEIPERSQIAIDGRDRHVEERPEFVGPDLAAVGDGQQQAQAACERGVFCGFLRWPITSRHHASRVPPS